MTKYLVCILCSNDLELLDHSLESVSNQLNYDDFEIFIIVNTLNDIFHNKVIEKYKSHNFTKLKKIIRTESNGYPGKGHNSVLSIFYHNLNYENLILIDGDDFLFSNALYKINNVMINENSDLIALVGNTKIDFTKSEIDYSINNNIIDFSIQKNFSINFHSNIKNISDDFNKLLIVPFRLLSTNRMILDKYMKLYDENMYIFDDFLFTIIIYNEIFNNNLNITLLSDEYIYLYNSINDNSVSHKNNNIKFLESDHKNKLKILKNFNIDINTYDLTKLEVKPYSTIINDNIKLEDNIFFLKNTILKLQNIIPFKKSIKKILFLDYSEWDFDTIKNRPLGGIESAFYNLSKILSEKYLIYVMTKKKVSKTINKNLHYLNLDESLIEKIIPDIIIFQTLCPLKISFLKKINKNIKLLSWCQHDINVSCINNKNLKFPFDKYIFVSNWQKYRFIQNFKLNINKCTVLQNGISELIDLELLKNIKKDKSLIYISTPYRGLLIAFCLFQEIKKIIPDIKFKIFSCFRSQIEKENEEYKPILDKSKMCNTELDIYYQSLYQILIDDPNIDYYGSVPQKILFEHLKTSMILFYPNTYAETCCTSILEAMAFRCNVISSELGAIPETSNGFASLFNPCIDFDPKNDFVKNPINYESISNNFKKNFIKETIDKINNYYSEYNQELLDSQQQYIKKCTWKERSKLFEKIIEEYII